jgi:hypothetical protein
MIKNMTASYHDVLENKSVIGEEATWGKNLSH